MKIFRIFADNLFAHEIIHFLSGIAMFFLMYSLFGKVTLSLIAFFVSILIDVDHYFEGLVYNRFKLGWIFNTYPHIFWQKLGKMTILFHSWELLLLIILLGKIFSQQSLSVVIVVPLILHYSIDNFIYSTYRKMPILQYFLLYRIYHRFDLKKTCREN